MANTEGARIGSSGQLTGADGFTLGWRNFTNMPVLAKQRKSKA
jgi:hypothetical protein